MLSACATLGGGQSASTPKAYLDGEPDPKTKATDIRDALSRRVHILRSRDLGKNEKTSGTVSNSTKTTIPSGTSIQLVPVTPPYLIASTRDSVEDEGYKQRWSEEKKNAEFKKRLADRKSKELKNQQCFEATITTPDFILVKDVFPNGTKLKFWHLELEQNQSKSPLKSDENLTCIISTGSVSYANNTGNSDYHSATNRLYTCPTLYCSKMSIDYLKPFKVNVDPRFEKDLIPVELEWKGSK